jgi:hypothetical protein
MRKYIPSIKPKYIMKEKIVPTIFKIVETAKNWELKTE